MVSKPHSALVLVGHGSTLNPDSSAPTHAHARVIRERNCFHEVVSCFWKEEPSMADVLRTVDADDVYVVPAFISEGYFTRTVIPRELRLDGPVTRVGRKTVRYCDPVGSHPRMTEVILHRAREVAPGVPESETSLLIVGHGTDLNDNSARAAKEQARLIAGQTRYAAVLNTYMEEEPLVSRWADLTDTPFVVVVPFFIADGLHSYQDIPVLLGIESEPVDPASMRTVFRRNPYRIRGRELYYASAVGTEPLVADVILDQVEAFDRQHAP
jgi:sirohydrochlorin cobaltochelatase